MLPLYLSLHYILKDEVCIPVMKNVILAISMAWIKLFKLSNIFVKFIYLHTCLLSSLGCLLWDTYCKSQLFNLKYKI